MNSANPTTALIIDGSKSASICLGKKLQTFDFKVDLAASGPDAIEKLNQTPQPLPDIIFFNRYLPDMEWPEFTKCIKSNPNWRNIRIIMCSAKPSEEIEKQALTSGVSAVIPKPATREQIQRIIIELGIDQINESMISSNPPSAPSCNNNSEHTHINHFDRKDPIDHTVNVDSLSKIEDNLTSSLHHQAECLLDELNQNVELKTREVVLPILLPLIEITINEQLEKKMNESKKALESSLLTRLHHEFTALSKGFWGKANDNLKKAKADDFSKTQSLLEHKINHLEDALRLEINTIKNETEHEKPNDQLKKAIIHIKNEQNSFSGQIRAIIHETKSINNLVNNNATLQNELQHINAQLIALEQKISTQKKQSGTVMNAVANGGQVLDIGSEPTPNHVDQAMADVTHLNKKIKAMTNSAQQQIASNLTEQIATELEKNILDIKEDVKFSLDHQKSMLNKVTHAVYGTIAFSTICVSILFALKLA